jgi:glucose-6-phosphate isomerase
MSDSTKLTSSPAWTALLAHYEATKDVQMKDMFASDPERFNKFHMKFEDMLFDFSKNRINEESMKLLYGLAKQADVSGLAKKMYAGEKISKSLTTIVWFFMFARYVMLSGLCLL